MVTQLDSKSHLWTVFVLQWLCYASRKSVREEHPSFSLIPTKKSNYPLKLA